jgi:hypothetical protein
MTQRSLGGLGSARPARLSFPAVTHAWFLDAELARRRRLLVKTHGEWEKARPALLHEPRPGQSGPPALTGEQQAKARAAMEAEAAYYERLRELGLLT